MGVAAYNRGTKAISDGVTADHPGRRVEFEIMDRLNHLQKSAKAQAPFGPIHFVTDHHGTWAMCPVSGFGYVYTTLEMAIQAWLVDITGCDRSGSEIVWVASPRK